MPANSAERNAFQAAKTAMEQSQDDMDAPYLLVADANTYTFTIHQFTQGAGFVTHRKEIAGLIFDAFHFGQALATRDALNAAFDAGYAKDR